jgi:hypothetical protein
MQSPIFGRDVIHSFTVSDIDEVQWNLGDKTLRAGLGANFPAEMRQHLLPAGDNVTPLGPSCPAGHKPCITSSTPITDAKREQ